MKYTNLEIIQFSTGMWCTLFTTDGTHDIFHNISYNEACKLMWELVKKGATKTLTVNPYRPQVNTRTIKLVEI